MSDQTKILIIDGNNMLYRSFTANPALNGNGQHVGGILGFFYSLQKSIKDVTPHQVIIVWDGRGGSRKRREIRKDYKEGRKPPKPLQFNRVHDKQGEGDDEKISLYYQQQRVIEILNHLPFIQLCEEGTEADDLISYINSRYSCKENYLKIIVSNDGDFIQLTNECTILYRPAKKEYITHKLFIEREGVHPLNMALSRAIEGDNADNLSGVKGVGRKTIVKHFPEFSKPEQIGLDDLKKMCESKVDCKPAKAILSQMEIVDQNYRIMQLYMPLITVTTRIRVDEQIDSFQFKMNSTLFREEWIKELITGTSFTPLLDHSYKMIRKIKND